MSTQHKIKVPDVVSTDETPKRCKSPAAALRSRNRHRLARLMRVFGKIKGEANVAGIEFDEDAAATMLAWFRYNFIENCKTQIKAEDHDDVIAPVEGVTVTRRLQ